MANNVVDLDSPIKQIVTASPETVKNSLTRQGDIAVGKTYIDSYSQRKTNSIFANVNSNVYNLLEYDSEYDDTKKVPYDIGKIKKGMTVGQLRKKTISQIIDMILFPNEDGDPVDPKITEPSLSVELTDFSYQSLIEIGTSPLPKMQNFTLNFDRGKIYFDDAGFEEFQDYRSGEKISEGIYSRFNNGEWSETFPEKAEEGTYDYKGYVQYAGGPVPKDSEGNPSSIPALEAGTIYSSIISFTATYPCFASYLRAEEMSKLPLTTSKTIEFTLQSEKDGYRHRFEIPKKWNLVKLEYYDPFVSRYEEMSLDRFDKTDVTEFIQGTSIEYVKYTRNEEEKSAKTQFKITIE